MPPCSAARVLGATVAWALIALGCGAGSGPVDDAGPVGEPPTVRSAGAELTVNGVSGFVDLDDGDVQRISVGPVPSVWTVQVRDAETPSDALEVAIVGADGAPLDDQTAAFERGNWLVRVALPVGVTASARVTDGDGNATRSLYSIIVPPLDEATADAWELRSYDGSQAIVGRETSELRADGTFDGLAHELVLPDETAERRTGTWGIEGSTLRVEERTRDGGDEDPETVERVEVTALFVNELYLSQAPFVRVAGDGAAFVGRYERAAEVGDGAPGGEVQRFTDELELGTGGAFVLERQSDPPGSTPLYREAGTYEVEPAENYETSLGDFLLLTVHERNGQTLAPAEMRISLLVPVGDLLLLDPLIRTE
ncbi:MAG: hypothetical protein ACFCGT_21085 [Sandaracinaceae bacterium]